MMLSHPVLLGFLWSLLVLSTSGQSQISNNESNKVYTYSYNFLHNGTTNSRDILRSILGADPEFGLDDPAGKSIVKTFSSPGITGFFTKGVLPAGPISHSFNSGVNSPYNAIRDIVQSNLQPPQNIATGLLPPISPDIAREFPGDYNNINDLGNVFQNQDDFPKIPPVPVITNNLGNRKVESFSRDTPDGGRIEGHVETFSYNSPPNTNSISRTEENSQGFRRNENILNNNREVTGHRTQSYFRTNFRTITPNIESNSYNNENSGISNRNARNNQWWNVLNVLGNGNNNLEATGPKIDKDVNENINRIQNNINRAFGARLSAFRNTDSALNNHRQNDYGNQRNNLNQNFNNPIVKPNLNNPIINPNFNNPIVNQNYNNPIANRNDYEKPVINQNINPLREAKNFNNFGENQNFNKPVDNQNFQHPTFNQNLNTPSRNQNSYNTQINHNVNNPSNNNHIIPNRNSFAFSRSDETNNYHNENNNNNFHNQVFNPIRNMNTHHQSLNNNAFPNNNFNNPITTNVNPSHQSHNNLYTNPTNVNNNPQFNKQMENKVMKLINDVSSHLKDVHNNQKVNNIAPVWDDDISRNMNIDWSTRRRPFSNGHSGSSNSPKPVDIIKSSLDAINRNIDIPRNEGSSYSNAGGGGVERFYGLDRTVESPNSYSRNQQRGYERDYNVNSDSGYNRANQWSTNTLRRLDAQSSSKADFSTDFIDVFRDDY